MATVLAYVSEEMYTSGRNDLLAEYVGSGDILRLFNQGVQEREMLRAGRSMTTSDHPRPHVTSTLLILEPPS